MEPSGQARSPGNEEDSQGKLPVKLKSASGPTLRTEVRSVGKSQVWLGQVTAEVELFRNMSGERSPQVDGNPRDHIFVFLSFVSISKV